MQDLSTSHDLVDAYSPGDFVEWRVRRRRLRGVVFCRTPSVEVSGLWTRADWNSWFNRQGLRGITKSMHRPAAYCYELFRRGLPWGGYLLFRNYLDVNGKFVISASNGHGFTLLGRVPVWSAFCRRLDEVALMRDKESARLRYVSFFDERSDRFAFRFENRHVGVVSDQQPSTLRSD